jgi:hypothetical protein
LAPTVGIAATGFCYPGGILQLFHRRYQQFFSTSSRSTTRTAEDSWSKDTEQYEEIKINKFCGCRQQQQADRIYKFIQSEAASWAIFIKTESGGLGNQAHASHRRILSASTSQLWNFVIRH